jgi:eukaryotic-like serine/threonine-protein kinase
MTDDTTIRARGPKRAAVAAEEDVLRADDQTRYTDLRELGAGGMGEVRLVLDCRLEREVALKRMRDAMDQPEDAARFLREVRVQGQLDHPAVVPVYDVGLTPSGTPWFTMKRVRGQTLGEVLHLLKQGDAATLARFSRWRLLSIFNTVCLCIDSAHARGVLHRDLKPGNVMLGEFGEVHVLDWGLARVKGRAVTETPSGRNITVADGLEATGLGMAMGTPGYMSPEQAQGRVDELDERTDVYALGVILHELLFLNSARDGETPHERLRARGSSQPPSAADLSLAPELDAICESEPGRRHASARELADDVERFLEGERDEARRQAMANEQLQLAEQALTDTHAGRGRALQALGRALALDPTNARALRRLSALLAEPPRETPPEAERQLQKLATTRAQQTLHATSLRLGSWTLGLVIAMGLLGVKSMPLAVMVVVLLSSATAVSALLARRSDAARLQFPAGLLGVVCVGALAVTLGPLVVVPALAATHAMLFATNAPPVSRRWMVLASALVVVLPALLNPLGSYVQLQGDALVLSSPLLRFDGSAAAVLLVLSLVPVITPAVLVGRLRDAFVAAERGVVIQSAALQQLIPDGK